MTTEKKYIDLPLCRSDYLEVANNLASVGYLSVLNKHEIVTKQTLVQPYSNRVALLFRNVIMRELSLVNLRLRNIAFLQVVFDPERISTTVAVRHPKIESEEIQMVFNIFYSDEQ